MEVSSGSACRLHSVAVFVHAVEHLPLLQEVTEGAGGNVPDGMMVVVRERAL